MKDFKYEEKNLKGFRTVFKEIMGYTAYRH